MPRVYVTNRSGHDFRPAEKFGDLVFLSEGVVNPFSVAKIYREFVEVLNNSAPDDYILVTGLSLMNGIAFSIMSRLHGRLNILQYHSQTRTYKSRTIMIDELLKKGNDERQTSPSVEKASDS